MEGLFLFIACKSVT